MDKETYVNHQTAADFDARSDEYLKSMTEDYLKVVPRKAAQELAGLEGIKDFSQVYVRMVPDEENTEDQADLAKVTKINGEATPDDITKFDRNRMMYGFDENAFMRAEVIEGEIDYEKLCSGDYVAGERLPQRQERI